MILHDLPYRAIFYIEGEGFFQKAALTIDKKLKGEGYIGVGDYYNACFIVEGNPNKYHVVTPIRVWIGCDQTVEPNDR